MSKHPTNDGDRQEKVKSVVRQEKLHPDVHECVDETINRRYAGPEGENYEVALVSQTWKV